MGDLPLEQQHKIEINKYHLSSRVPARLSGFEKIGNHKGYICDTPTHRFQVPKGENRAGTRRVSAYRGSKGSRSISFFLWGLGCPLGERAERGGTGGVS